MPRDLGCRFLKFHKTNQFAQKQVVPVIRQGMKQWSLASVTDYLNEFALLETKTAATLRQRLFYVVFQESIFLIIISSSSLFVVPALIPVPVTVPVILIIFGWPIRA